VSGVLLKIPFFRATRYDRTTVRALTTIYTNTTGKVINVLGYLTYTVAGTITITIAGIIQQVATVAIGTREFNLGIVKEGETMQITVTGTATLTKWFEIY
jgi:hypothetical protein